jgi:hypothetical protein
LRTARILSIKNFTFDKVHFYTIEIDDELSEFADFVTRMKQSKLNTHELGELTTFIKEIGVKYGAKKSLFRHEAAAEALAVPTVSHIDIDSEEETHFGLRLYCIRLTDSIVILLNGDRKTTQKAQDCPNCKYHFQLANKISIKITKAIIEQEIILEDKSILFDEDFELNF